MVTCRGSFLALLLYDVAEEFDLDQLRKLLGVGVPARSPGFKLPAPEYVRFERPPVVESCEPIRLSTGDSANASLRYFDYGVVSLQFEMQFDTDWPGVIALSNQWVEAGEVERRGLKTVRDRLTSLGSAIRKPYAEWLDEAYYVIHLRGVYDEKSGAAATGPQLIAEYGRQISQVIRGETQPLSEGEQKEVLTSSISYYPSDVMVVGWLAALVYDTSEGAAPLTSNCWNMPIPSFSNTAATTETLTALLKDAYVALERRAGLFSRWHLARAARNLNRLRLEVTELTERTDNAIKFLSDMYYARAYRLAASKVGVGDYRSLVDQKLRTAGEFYEFMVNEFREARGFILELMVIVILIIELVPILRK